MKVLIKEKIINVPFKGNRTYVYASDLFGFLITEIKKMNIDDIQGVDFSVHKFMNNKVTFDLYELDKGEIIDTPADVRLNFNSKGIDYVGLIFQNELIINERTIYDENDFFKIIEIDQNNSSAIIKNNHLDYSNLDIFTSMNKFLLKELRPDIKGKWVSVRLQIDSLYDLLENHKSFKVILKKVFSNKYTRSELFNDNKKIGNLYFSII